jgi:gamma-glutamylcyclotransferase (GGCT)/AIG2-like uncharacterized protein YtfP
MKTRIFVYGTLKKGRSNHHYLENQLFVGSAMTEPRYRLYDMGGFPGLVLDAEHGLAILGEVWEVDKECLGALDILEGIDEGEYVRELMPLQPPYDQVAVQGYRFLRSVAGRRDLGAIW